MSEAHEVIIVDDEPLARYKLRRLFEQLPDFRVSGEAGDGRAALALIGRLRPGVLCLDIRLPGMSGLDVLRQAHSDAAVIFTTAFDRYAVTAFELAAVDYLLKPFSTARFLAAIERVRSRLSAAAPPSAGERLRDVSESGYLARLFTRDGDVVRPIPVAAVQHLEASDDAVIVHAEGRRYRINVTLTELEGRLDPVTFVRIHRSMIVNLEHVASVEPLPTSRFSVRLKDGTALAVSRQRSRLFRGRGL